jgi:hypothetical protein
VCAGEVWTEGGFTLALFQGWGMGSEVLLEQVQLNFSFRNKFIILLPYGLLVDNNAFSKICVFKSLTWLHCLWWLKTEIAFFLNNNEIKRNEKLMLVILNCTLLHNQNDGWTVPYPYLMVCFKNVT